MTDISSSESGRQALARLLKGLAEAARRLEDGESADAVTNEIWTDFRSAVAAAMAELREAEVRGLQRWQQARHT